MHQRLNITLPAQTVQLLDRVAPKGDRSRYIDQAVRECATRQSQKNLRRLLKEGALAHYDEDRQMAEEWFFLEEEAWEKAQHRKR
jgi:CopG family transcriptional regulator/antitoxin EndoAI